ncbi:MAG: SGNH/GDSL hydrolase family protein [Dehalococcoidia bacterium]
MIFAGCGGSAESDCPSGSIIALGDSITFGADIPHEDSYPSQLANYVQQHVCNAGINGDKVDDALDRLQRDLLSHHPSAVVILLGANDIGLFGFPTEPDEFSRSLSAIVERVRASGAEPVLCSLLPIDATLLKRSLLRPERWSEYAGSTVTAEAVADVLISEGLATAVTG